MCRSSFCFPFHSHSSPFCSLEQIFIAPLRVEDVCYLQNDIVIITNHRCHYNAIIKIPSTLFKLSRCALLLLLHTNRPFCGNSLVHQCLLPSKLEYANKIHSLTHTRIRVQTKRNAADDVLPSWAGITPKKRSN